MQLLTESIITSSPLAAAQRVLRFLADAIHLPREGPWEFADYELDPQSAFFPRQPLAALPGPFSIWEAALVEAPDVLRLGTDNDEEALALRTQGARWREAIRQVTSSLQSCQLPMLMLVNSGPFCL
jgi:indoleamine 2,3-dioxygenase